MKLEELRNAIAKFDENVLKQKSVFGIFQIGSGTDESYIKANKEGLVLFAIQLVKASNELESIHTGKEKNIIPLDYAENWILQDSQTFLHYIEPTTEKQIDSPSEESRITITDKIMPYGCALVLIVLVISTLVGLVTMIKWISN